MTAPRDLIIDLSAWIIQDGNYEDFERNQQTSFALEFYPGENLQVCVPGVPPSLALISNSDWNARYNVAGRVVHVAEDWWVVDFGILAFHEGKASKHKFREGDCVGGHISLSVDKAYPGVPGVTRSRTGGFPLILTILALPWVGDRFSSSAQSGNALDVRFRPLGG